MIHTILSEGLDTKVVVAVAIVAGSVILKLVLDSLRRSPVFIVPDAYREFPLVEKENINHNTRRFRFALPDSNRPLGLGVGKHITLCADIDGSPVMRPYTPTTTERDLGFFDIVAKIYPQGKMTQHLDHMKIGDKIKVKGPKGRFEYRANMKRHIGMISGGTGITPLMQVAQEILHEPEDKTKISLLFANWTEDDILLKGWLDETEKKHPDQFKVYHVLNNPPENWKQGQGFISEQHIRQNFPAPADDVLICICGPPPMVKAMVGHLEKIGFTKDMIFKF